MVDGFDVKVNCELPLLQLRVLAFGLLQDGDVGVGVFPNRKKVFIGCSSF
jgi:hypothetical protein